MSTSEDYFLREQHPLDSLIPALDRSLELSEKELNFLLHAIRDLSPEAVDAETEIRKRVLDVQKKAYQIYPYPCIHSFYHVTLPMSENNAFSHILKAGQSVGNDNAPVILDIGCCMGTDLRYLAQSGYPATSIIGCDIRPDFIDLGHTLYGDRNTCQISFFIGDIFDITLGPFPQQADKACSPLKDVRSLNELRGRVKFIYAGLLFHLFDEGTQEAIARRLATLLNVTEVNGPAVIFGRHLAKPEESVIDDAMGRTRYAHSPASWGKLWERVLGGKNRVHVDAGFLSDTDESMWNPGRGTEMMGWSVWVG